MTARQSRVPEPSPPSPLGRKRRRVARVPCRRAEDARPSCRTSRWRRRGAAGPPAPSFSRRRTIAKCRCRLPRGGRRELPRPGERRPPTAARWEQRRHRGMWCPGASRPSTAGCLRRSPARPGRSGTTSSQRGTCVSTAARCASTRMPTGPRRQRPARRCSHRWMLRRVPSHVAPASRNRPQRNWTSRIARSRATPPRPPTWKASTR
mmetsp:Transcript_27149/g.68927  ORF Transcript_27149/g.68927 Transcript_27149/m.68927 type:complete len:207 (-) Transcript_27149:1628-2248(-)